MALIAVDGARSDPPARPAESELIARARSRDAAAWDAIYTEHYSAIFKYVWFRLPDREAAEDLAAEVFLEALRGIGRYEYRGVPFRAWLYRIARNLTLDARRKQGALAVAEAPFPAGFDASDGSDFATSVGRREDIRRALARLTDDQQQVIILRFLAGLSLTEAAAALSRREGAVKALQHRALARLRSILEDDGRDFGARETHREAS